MKNIPSFESVAIVSDEPRLAAEIASLFKRPRHYLAVIDGPRMTRPDANNEVIRRKNALALARPRRIILAGLHHTSASAIAEGWDENIVTRVDSIGDAVDILKGWVKRPKAKMEWGCNNLGIGLLLARRAKVELMTSTEPSPVITFVSGGKHLLIVCESGEDLAEISSSCLAFSTNAALLIIPKQEQEERDVWLDELYSIANEGDVSSRFSVIRDRARDKLGSFQFDHFKQILFVTSGFPWGISVPECITSHMYNYPDFGRCMVTCLWATQDHKRSARNALMIDPQKVISSEIRVIEKLLKKNGTLVRLLSGPQAKVFRVSTLVDTLPFDIIAISTHAGDAQGQRSTYEYVDKEDIKRCLVVDEAIGFSYDPMTDKFGIQQYEHFQELDGVNWNDRSAKADLYIGSAIESWVALGDLLERDKYKVSTEAISRVVGSMALQMYDHLWMPMLHGLPPGAAPLIFNNACSSWHKLGNRFMFAGARGYIGTLFPVTDSEAQEIGRLFFKTHPNSNSPQVLWRSQNMVYGNQVRRPYAMFGLPWCTVRPNTTKSVTYMMGQYRNAIDEFSAMLESSSKKDTKENCQRYLDFIKEDFKAFVKHMD